MERRGIMRGGDGGSANDWDLSDIVLSWSFQEILDDRLYKDQVQKIPDEFLSIDQYLNSYIAPLKEETRSDLCSSLKLITEAPNSKILRIEQAGSFPRLSYYIDVCFSLSASSENYMARNGDVFILSSMKPEAAEDFFPYGVTYCLAVVTEVAMDANLQKGLKVKVSKNISEDVELHKYTHAVFLTNIMSNIRIWKALCYDSGVNNNFSVIKSILVPIDMAQSVCDICIGQSQDRWPSFLQQLRSLNLNQPQVGSVEGVISSVKCKHSNHIKLIWGPPGTGKTKTVCAMLWALRELKCRTLTCAPTNVAVVGVCSRLLHMLHDFSKQGDVRGLPCSLGDVVLFGSKDKINLTDELKEVFLDCRVDELVDCLSSVSGWKCRISSMISLLEDCGSRFEMLLEDNQDKESESFLDFFKKQFDSVAVKVKNCFRSLCIHLPEKCFSHKNLTNILNILGLLENFHLLLHDKNLTNDDVKIIFGLLSIEETVGAKHGSSMKKKLEKIRLECLELLRVLQGTLKLPYGLDQSSIQKYCLRNATLFFCTASSSYRLHYMEMNPLDVLIVDEAAQLRECELVIPLRLHWLRHIVLVGDDRQLGSMVRSQVCKDAGFGISLFERLVSLGFGKHLLNVQYRMDPCISSFPNAYFYDKKILDGLNVTLPSFNQNYSSLMFGTYAFIDIADEREEMDNIGKSRRNMVEVAMVLHLVQTIFKFWKNTGDSMTIGIISPYSSQVSAIKGKMGAKYDKHDGFDVRVKSVDGFQGEEDDVIILSTVRSNSKGTVGFLADNQRMNVALTRAKHCLWILGSASTLAKSGTIWANLVVDAKERKCLFKANDDISLSKLILPVKHELDDLLNSSSVLFSNTRWKVIFSDEFRESFIKLKSSQLKKEVIELLSRLGSGWRSRIKNLDITDSFEHANVHMIRDVYLVWCIDLEKNERLFQIIKIWDILPLQHVERTVKRLQNMFSLYAGEYLGHCRQVRKERRLEVPIIWKFGHDVVRYKKDMKSDSAEAGGDEMNSSCAMENLNVNDSFLLMKFYTLSSGVAKYLLTASDVSDMDVPFELNDQEEEIIRFPLSSVILDQSHSSLGNRGRGRQGGRRGRFQGRGNRGGSQGGGIMRKSAYPSNFQQQNYQTPQFSQPSRASTPRQTYIPILTTPKAQCQICGKYNHSALQCRHRFNHNFVCDKVAQSFDALSISNTECDSEVCYPDTHASDHIIAQSGQENKDGACSVQ